MSSLSFISFKWMCTVHYSSCILHPWHYTLSALQNVQQIYFKWYNTNDPTLDQSVHSIGKYSTKRHTGKGHTVFSLVAKQRKNTYITEIFLFLIFFKNKTHTHTKSKKWRQHVMAIGANSKIMYRYRSFNQSMPSQSCISYSAESKMLNNGTTKTPGVSDKHAIYNSLVWSNNQIFTPC